MKYNTNAIQSQRQNSMSWVSKVRKPKAVKPEEGEIEDVYDLDAWKKGMVYLVKGARWGDIDNYADADIEENMKKPVIKEKAIVKTVTCDNCSETCETVIKKRGLGMVCLVCFDTVKAPPPPVKKQKCKGCSFHIHSNPPTDFTPEQRMYCCTICQTSKGHKHGGRCEQGYC